MASSISTARVSGAIVGSLVADAAVMGLHWIYDLSKLKEAIDAGDGVLFHTPPACPFYEYESGASTPYGDESKAVLDALHSTDGAVDTDVLVDKYAAFVRGYAGRKNHAAKEFLANVEAGKKYPDTGFNSSDSQAVFRAAVVAPLYAGKPDVRDKTVEVVKVEQSHPDAIDAASATAAILDHLVAGASVPETVAWLKDGGLGWTFGAASRVKATIALADRFDHADLVAVTGSSCTLPGSVLGALHAVALHPDDMQAALRATVLAGGDSAGRAAFIGAVFGATGDVPAELKAKCGPWLAGVEAQAAALAAKVTAA